MARYGDVSSGRSADSVFAERIEELKILRNRREEAKILGIKICENPWVGEFNLVDVDDTNLSCPSVRQA